MSWDPNADSSVAGYRLKYGTASGTYAQTIDVGNATSATVPNLTDGDTYFFAVTAYNASSIESSPSNEVSYTILANQPPTVSLTSSAGSSVVAPANISLTAAASDVDGTIARVEFYSGTTKVGEVTSSPYVFGVTLADAGTYSFTAVAVDNGGAATASSPVSVNVTAPVVATQPKVSALNYLATGGAQISVTSTAGQTVSIYASTDLKTWALLTSAVNDTGTLTVTDPAATTLNQRFYRVTDGTWTTDPAGFSKLRIAGITGSQTSAFSYLGMCMTNPPSYQGTVTSRGVQAVVDSQADWTVDQFNGVNGEFYLEITSGANAGMTTDILATDASTKTLTTDDDWSTILTGGERYTIRKHRTIGDVFGKNNEAGLKSGSTVTASDEVRIFNPVTQAFLVYYFKAGAGWRSSTDDVTDASGTKLYLEQGVAVCRKAAGDIKLALTGAVKTGPTIVPIGANLNLVANVYPAGTLTLGNCGLYTGSLSGFAGASGLSNADEVRIWNGTAFLKYFYKTGGTGGIGWRISTNTKADASATQIPVGSSIYVVRKKGRPAFNWNMPQPF